ncbi:MAG: hypothetical protein AAGF07_01205 [Patescibacteria group bacterium]
MKAGLSTIESKPVNASPTVERRYKTRKQRHFCEIELLNQFKQTYSLEDINKVQVFLNTEKLEKVRKLFLIFQEFQDFGYQITNELEFRKLQTQVTQEFDNTKNIRSSFKPFDKAIQIKELVDCLVAQQGIMDQWLDSYNLFIDQIKLASIQAGLRKFKPNEILSSCRIQAQTLQNIIDSYSHSQEKDVFIKPIVVIQQILTKSVSSLLQNHLLINKTFNPFCLELVLNDLDCFLADFENQKLELDVFLAINLLKSPEPTASHMYKLYSAALRTVSDDGSTRISALEKYTKKLIIIKTKLAPDFRIYDYEDAQATKNLPIRIKQIYRGYNTNQR